MSKRTRRKQRGPKAQPQRRNPRFVEHVRCERCLRYRLSSEPCWACLAETFQPPACTCDLEWPPAVVTPGPLTLWQATPDAHRHWRHHLLEHLSQVDYETSDDAILLDAERMPGPGEEVAIEEVADPAPRQLVDHMRRIADWRKNPELLPHLTAHPDLFQRAQSRGPARLPTGTDAIFEWAGLTDNEATVMSLRLQGYTLEAIAFELRRQEVWVESLLGSAGARLNIAIFGHDVKTWPRHQGWMWEEPDEQAERQSVVAAS